MSNSVPDLAVVVVSTNEAHWLVRCLSSVFAHAGEAHLDVVVVDNESTDGTRELVDASFPAARVVGSPNHGFGYANNRGLETTDARYVLLLNPDTEVLEGSFGELVRILDRRPEVGIVGVRQLTANRQLFPTIRRFPSAARALGEAFGSERWPVHPAWSGERVLEPETYEQDSECDWMSGSFMLARRHALLSAGLLDERFFIYSEEPDLCLRIKRAGWSVRHLPQMTILHHACKGGVRPRMVAQDAFARRQYAQKHFLGPQRVLYLCGLGARHVIRAASATVSGEDASLHREAAQLAIRTLTGRADPPFGPPPATALQPDTPPPTALQPRMTPDSSSAPEHSSPAVAADSSLAAI
jgi:N-acetylglucosaminyl-diphospho-decaprenol L-rhamnosyltransferase